MSEQWWVATVIGAILACVGGIAVEWYREYKNNKCKTNLFTKMLKDDFIRSIKLYEELIKVWNNNCTVWLGTLAYIRASRELYHRYKEWILIYPESLRSKIFEYYHKSDIAINYLEYLQNRNTQIGIKVCAIEGQLKSQFPNISSKDINDQIMNVLTFDEKCTSDWVAKAIPNKIHEIEVLLLDAKNILQELK